MEREPNTFTAAGIDRATTLRSDAERIEELAGDPAARALLTSRGELAVDVDGRPLELALTDLDGSPVPRTLLGLRDGAALFAVEDGERIGARAAGLRDLAARLGQAEAALAATAVAAGNWHLRNRHCANCGTATEVREAGWTRSCPACEAQHHPRIDPVVIMLVIDDERCRVMLGRQPSWPTGRYSALAGFVEPGESLEEAVAREVAEEAGVSVERAVYRSSQPWPFPGSLMIGFHCRWTAGEPSPRDGELEDARWFEPGDLGDLILPPRLAIARRLIDEWLADVRG